MRAALIAINHLPPMQFGGADNWADTSIAFDVPLTILRGPPSKKGGVGVALSRQEYLGPIADWRFKMESTIQSCWRDTPVAIPGVTIIERLASEADAEAWAR